MARTRYINRTLVSTDAEVMTVNPATKEVGSVVITITGTYTDIEDKALDKAVRKAFNEGGYDSKFVSITSITPVTKAYRMLESEFIKLAECSVLEQGATVDEEDEDEE